MSAFLGLLRRRFFGIATEETTFARRGFRTSVPGAQEHLENIGRTFSEGYHAALETPEFDALVPRLNSIPAEVRGFAFEGAAMGLGLLDKVTPWKRDRVQGFVGGAGEAHSYMVYVGLGWILARLGGRVEPALAKLDPLLRWLAVDGYGFHEAFFHWENYRAGQPAPRRLEGYARRAFDQGMGRCLWFIEGCDVLRIPAAIEGFREERRADLWSGVGLAATYAGEVGEAELRSLLASAGPFQPYLAQGSAFAAKARQRAGNLMPYTERACQILCGVSAPEAAQVTDAALENLPSNGPEPAFEMWRRRIQARFLESTQPRS